MSAKLSRLGLGVKWIVVPLGLAAFGAYVVGPRLGPIPPQIAKDVASKLGVNVDKTGGDSKSTSNSKPRDSAQKPPETSSKGTSFQQGLRSQESVSPNHGPQQAPGNGAEDGPDVEVTVAPVKGQAAPPETHHTVSPRRSVRRRRRRVVKKPPSGQSDQGSFGGVESGTTPSSSGDSGGGDDPGQP